VNELEFSGAVVVSPSDSVRTAVESMRSASSSCVLAVRDGRVAGIFTERDVLTRCMNVDGFDWDQPLEASVMTANPECISRETVIADAIGIMQKHGYRTLPVTQGDELLGLVRLGDLLKNIAEAFPEEILNLPPRPNQVAESREGG
jgi:CBS domain-containing protein